MKQAMLARARHSSECRSAGTVDLDRVDEPGALEQTVMGEAAFHPRAALGLAGEADAEDRWRPRRHRPARSQTGGAGG